MRNGKYRIAAIIICFLVCTIGISYYVKGCSNIDTKENMKQAAEVKGIDNCSQKKKEDYESLKKAVSEIRNIKNILYCFDNNKLLVQENNKILLEEINKKSSKEVKGIKSNVKIISADGNNKYVSWIETSEVKKGYQILRLNTLYLYDIEKDSIIKLDESKYDMNSSNIYSVTHDIGCNIRIKGNKLFYLCFKYDGYKFNEQYIKEYDIESRKQSVLYRQPFKKNNTYVYLYDFDLDLEKSYLAFCIKYYGDVKGYALMISDIGKDNSSKLLAVSENEIKPTIKYPYMSFQVGNDVHLYNIVNKDDDFQYESKSSISGVKMCDNMLFWDEDKIYCYSMNDKKIYAIDDDEYSGKSFIRGKAMCWQSSTGIRYISIK